MAEKSTIARPYAEALFRVAASGDLAVWSETLTGLASIAADARIEAIIADPRHTADDLYRLLSGLLLAANEKSSDAQSSLRMTEFTNLLRVLIDNDRLALLPEIARQFRQLRNAREGVADAVIRSAYPLSDSQVAECMAALQEKFGTQLKAQVLVDPSLIGGISVAVGDEVLDGSVRHQLERMRATLAA